MTLMYNRSSLFLNFDLPFISLKVKKFFHTNKYAEVLKKNQLNISSSARHGLTKSNLNLSDYQFYSLKKGKVIDLIINEKNFVTVIEIKKQSKS